MFRFLPNKLKIMITTTTLYGFAEQHFYTILFVTESTVLVLSECDDEILKAGNP